ncbi:MAG: hypothetical protein HYX27_00360 [Acidobacteria bacterium]|nr:hypothetical protein [Acidobacteriota bacterium]
MPRGIVIGIALQLASWGSAWLFSRYLYAIGWLAGLLISVPLFVASPFYLMRAPAPLWVRLLLSFWILLFPAYYLGLYVWENWQLRTEIVLIPVEFQGKAKVHFGETGGAAEELEGGKLLLRLGKNGELHTRASQRKFASDSLNEARWRGREYYSVTPDGKRVRLEEPNPLEGAALAPGQIVIFGMGESWEGNRIRSADFYVGTREFILGELRGK